jgi:hypothetical protein
MSKIKVGKTEKYERKDKKYGARKKLIFITARAIDLDIKAGPELKNHIKGQYRLKKIDNNQLYIDFFLQYYIGKKRKRIPEDYMLRDFLVFTDRCTYYHNYSPDLNSEIDLEILKKAVERGRKKVKKYKLPKKYEF